MPGADSMSYKLGRLKKLKAGLEARWGSKTLKLRHKTLTLAKMASSGFGFMSMVASGSEMDCLIALVIRSSKPRCWQDHAPSEGATEESVASFTPGFQESHTVLGCRLSF